MLLLGGLSHFGLLKAFCGAYYNSNNNNKELELVNTMEAFS